MALKFSIITPSYKMLDWLRCCVASVRDQKDISVEHLIHDACSPDGTPEWLASQSDLDYRSEPDEGMYDAINRGLRRATGDILAYLNCDEQYLPGTLAKVAAFFETHPDVEAVFGDFIVVDQEGDFRACRKVLCPSAYLTRIHTMPVGTCATFFRRSLLDRHALFYNTKYKAIADKIWAMDLVKSGARMELLKSYTSAFGTTGSNLAYSEVSLAEMKTFGEEIPRILRLSRPFAKALFRFRKWRRGSYKQAPFSYRIFTRNHLHERKTFQVADPRFRLAEFR